MRITTLAVAVVLVSGCGQLGDEAHDELGTMESELAGFGPWSSPVNLQPAVNSLAVDAAPALSRDGLSLYFASTRAGGAGGLDLWVSRRESLEAPWGEPINVSVLNTGAAEQCPLLTPDGRHLFFASNRPGCGGLDLWVTRRADESDDLSWEAPVNLGCTVNSAANDFGPSVAGDESGRRMLYFNSNRPGGKGGLDIYVSAEDDLGAFGAASLIAELSTPYNDARPNVRHDGKELFFESNRPGSQGTDIWVAKREEEAVGPWSAPERAPFNSAATDGRAMLSFDGRTLLFMSDRAGGSGGMDLWMVTRLPAHGVDAP